MSNPAASHEDPRSGVVQAGPSEVVPVTSSTHPWTVASYTARAALPFGVLESWCNLYQRSHSAGVVPNNVADAVWSEAVSQLLTRGAVMHVAVNPARPDHWLGYALTERTGDGVPVVHLAFVKPAYRRSGVLRSLLVAADIDRLQRLFWTFQVGPERRIYPAGRFEPSIARRLKA